MSSQRITRDQVVELARRESAWTFLPLGLQVVEQHIQDHGIRFLVAQALGQLGLRTLARAQLALLPPQIGGLAEVGRLEREVSALADDRVPLELRRATLRANARALAARGVDLGGAAERVADEEAGWECYVARGGEMVRRPAGSWRVTEWRWLAELRAQARALAGQAYAMPDDLAMLPPMVIEGVSPPWMLLEACERSPATRVGYQPTIRVVQRDPAELCEGLVLADLRGVIAQQRVRWYVGDDAGTRLRAELEGRMDARVGGPCAVMPTTRARVDAPAVPQMLKAVSERQLDELGATRTRVESRYAGRDAAWWARRYAEASEGGPPLRVLIPTCRFSTYIQHAAEDLARAFRGVGCRAEVLIEPDMWTGMSNLAYWSLQERLEPDLIVLANYPRTERADSFVRDVPFVCWMQDAMGHLYDRDVGAAQGELDFIAGVVGTQLFSKHGWAPERALFFPVTPNVEKFHDGDADPGLIDRLTCDVAYVSHQSETPEAMHRRLCDEAGDPSTRALLDLVRPLVEREAGRFGDPEPLGRRIHEAIKQAFVERTGRRIEPEQLSRLQAQYATPMAERIVRHLAVGWAAEICRRRGWAMKLFGRGWERHPELGSLACGELEHGDALRAAYRCAGVQLHPTVNDVTHQRVMECALSGGLPIVTRTSAMLASKMVLYRRAGLRAEDGRPGDGHAYERRYPVIDHPPLALALCERQRLGLADADWAGGALRLRTPQLDTARSSLVEGHGALTGAWLLGDAEGLSFRDGRELERVLERALGDGAWRASRSAGIAARVRARLTIDAFARELIRFLGARLAAGARVAEAVA